MNGRASKSKGYRGEVEAVEVLTPVFPDAERYGNVNGSNDLGDIKGVPGWAVQVKNVATASLGAFVKDARTQADRLGARYAGVMLKLKGKHMRDSVFVMSNAQAVAIMKRLDECTCERRD
ncbi:hypothetical protein [Streptacidiphilus albus]|uniref:hypothetical protein n=1 Tax=Streptacidiphilus albus TaxID=105425 RepID=UPI00128D5FBD|nr:hypothetical protein [Streptacidiphilus albus]